jgi:hypothetical protein
VNETIQPVVCGRGASWSAHGAWNLGLPNAVAASGSHLALARGPKVEIGRLDGSEVVGVAGTVLGERVLGLAWQPHGLVATTRSGGLLWDGTAPGTWTTASPALPLATALPDETEQARPLIVRDDWPTDPSPIGSAFLVMSIASTNALASDGWEWAASTMDGVWLVGSDRRRTARIAPRPATALTGDDHLWALFDDEVSLIRSADGLEPSIRFERPLTACATHDGVLVGTQDRTWHLSSGVAVVHPHGASDLIVRDEEVVTVHDGRVRVHHESTGSLAVSTHVGGEPCRLAEGEDRRVIVAAAPTVSELSHRLVVERQWEVLFGPLAAIAMGDRMLICGGESGLYLGCEDGDGVVPLDLGLPAALDVCAVIGGAVVSTGAGLVRIDGSGDLRVTHQTEWPGVSALAGDGSLVVALVGDQLVVFDGRDLSPLANLEPRSDPHRMTLAGRTVVVCGYDAIEVIPLV